MKVAILYICTGKYNQFFDGFYESAEKFFLKGKASKEYFVWTDDMMLSKRDNVHLLERQCQGFPRDSLLRFEIFVSIKERLKEFDYTFFFNANSIFVKETNEEFLPQGDDDFVAGSWKMRLSHPMFYPYERNKKSTAYIPPGDKPYKYYGGFFNGGKASAFVEMAETLAKNTRIDLKNGIIACVHDESHLNSYLHKNRKCTPLPKEYIIPEEWLKENEAPFVILRDKVRIDKYFDKNRKRSFGAKLRKAYRKYIRDAIKWYF